ncbi:MAG: acyl-ACP--UDP-N-acetylglucosamine O-acyltransferase [Vampirovibrionales bacterium]|jgi:UDP-N-acetylglucosamine acyltransferase|nr:acyl-ACP--UDP-N-acetylglucosamine O-acyltransferase [Vampirovibrionales bacterium]
MTTHTPTPLIHPTAFIDETATVHPTAEIGAYCFIGPYCEVGEGCVLHHHASLVTHTTLGKGNVVHSNVVLGGDPQDAKYKGETSFLRIGDYNTFREFSSLHRATGEGLATTIGDHNYIMAYSHIGHNCRIGNHNTVANAAQIAGHVVMDDYIVIGGLVACHQGVHIASYAMIGGCSGIRKNIPPYSLIFGAEDAQINGINVVGLRRNGFDAETRTAIKRAYKCLFYEKGSLKERLQKADESNATKNPAIQYLIDFVANADKRGICNVKEKMIIKKALLNSEGDATNDESL